MADAAPVGQVPDARRELAIAGATLAGVVAAVFGTSIIAALRLLFGGSPPNAGPEWGDRVAALEWDVVVVAVVVVVVVRWLPRHAPAVTNRLLLSTDVLRRVPGRLAGAAAVYVAVATLSTRLGEGIVDRLHLPHGGYLDAGTGVGSLLTTGAGALAAGLTEEIVLLALAAAVVQQACAHRPRWSVPATLAVLIALRWLVHCYYGWDSLFVLAWVPGAYAIYRWAGSVWPLIVGHCAYDWLAATAQAYPSLTHPTDLARWTLTGVGVVAVVTGLYRSRAGAADVPHGKEQSGRWT